MDKRRMLIVTGGGSGGHVLPGLAIADEWRNLGGDVLFVGARGGLEERLVPPTGIPLVLLKVGKLMGGSRWSKLLTLIGLPIAIVRSCLVLLKHRPDSVIGVGGFASGPMVLASSTFGKWFLGIRTAIVEPNAQPGFTNRVLAKKVDDVFTLQVGAFEVGARTQIHECGYPVRNSIQALSSGAELRPLRILAFGGSQGAFGLNSMVSQAVSQLNSWKVPFELLHQTGPKDFARIKGVYSDLNHVDVTEFIDDMASAYEQSSLVICRAGMTTLSEIASARRAAIIIPLPTAVDNHQYKNAKVLADQGAAVLLEQGDSNGSALAELIRDFEKNREKIRAFEEKISHFSRPGAAKLIVDVLRQKK